MTPISPSATRHRILEGVLLRLARRSIVGEFVLRGGMLMRHWFHPIARQAEDIDLVVSYPLDVEEITHRILPVLEDDLADGVCFDDRAQVEAISLDVGTGVRVYACGMADGIEIDFHIDVTFGPPSCPAPVFSELPTSCGEPLRLWACQPEAVVGHKVQAIYYRGLLGWRPKDLDDLRLLLRMPVDAIDLRDAIDAYLTLAGGTLEDVRAIFGPGSWWGMKMSAARWRDFVQASRRQDIPRDLASVVAEVRHRLFEILERAK